MNEVDTINNLATKIIDNERKLKLKENSFGTWCNKLDKIDREMLNDANNSIENDKERLDLLISDYCNKNILIKKDTKISII